MLSTTDRCVCVLGVKQEEARTPRWHQSRASYKGNLATVAVRRVIARGRNDPRRQKSVRGGGVSMGSRPRG
jgi:hypothetical protein